LEIQCKASKVSFSDCYPLNSKYQLLQREP